MAKWRFIEIPYQTCNHPGGDYCWERGQPKLYCINDHFTYNEGPIVCQITTPFEIKEDLCLGDFNWTFLGNVNWIFTNNLVDWLVDSLIQDTHVECTTLCCRRNPYEFNSLTVAPLCLFLRRSTMTARMVHIMWSVESRTMMKTCFYVFMMWFCLCFFLHICLCSLFLNLGRKSSMFSFVSGHVSMCFVSFLYHLKLEITNLKCSWRCADGRCMWMTWSSWFFFRSVRVNMFSPGSWHGTNKQDTDKKQQVCFKCFLF